MIGKIKGNKNRKSNRLGNLLNIGTMCIVLVVALGLLGASYALWNQTFVFSGSITTGQINVIVRDVVFLNSDGYDSKSFNVNKVDSIVDSVDMNFVTSSNPFNAILAFTIENTGTVPVVCNGIDPSVPDSIQVQMVDPPKKIDVGQTATINVKIIKGYCKDFEFSTFLKFVQATG